MSCFHPITAYRSFEGRNSSGKWPLVFSSSKGYVDLPVTVPCGRCIGCRLERSKQWATRCVHEASLYENNCFITLTFNNENLNKDLTLNKDDYTKFMKRLRKYYYGNSKSSVRYFHCGEYGSENFRPHHHSILFNFDFDDKYFYMMSGTYRLYRSPTLEKLWPYGFCTIGEASFDSCAYVARYIMKKVTGNLAEEHYNGRVPEYITMSRRPGIAHDWFSKFKTDVYPHDYVVIRNGIKAKPPRYYDNLFDIYDHETMVKLKKTRERFAKESCNNTSERLSVREEISRLKLDSLDRSL